MFFFYELLLPMFVMARQQFLPFLPVMEMMTHQRLLVTPGF
jgi:hypothetical protein